METGGGGGGERIMLEHEERGLPYLFKQRHTPKVRDLVVRMMRQGALWQDCGEVWLALEPAIRLSGWTRDRCGGTPPRAIRTRAMLIAGVGRQVQSGGQRTVKVSILDEKSDVIAKAATGSVENGSPACQLAR